MKYLVLLAFCAVAATASFIPEAERVNGKNGWYVPQVDGSFEWVDSDEAHAFLNEARKLEGRLFTNPVTFILYTRSEPSVGYPITTSKQTIDASPFNAANPTRITIHGWTSSQVDPLNIGTRSASFKHGDYNMITVDWARARSIDYASSVLAVPGVGEQIATLLEFLVTNYQLNLNNVEIIGHSLGAHVAGFTGKNLVSGQCRSIVGLDTALPLYWFNEPSSRLSSTDASYVESIHTNGGKLGFLEPIGKGAFYPNGGENQPGCILDITGSCAHKRATAYYVEAVEYNNFATVKCVDYENAVANKCGNTYSNVRMGAVNNAYMVAGEFYVPVNSASPFGALA